MTKDKIKARRRTRRRLKRQQKHNDKIINDFERFKQEAEEQVTKRNQYGNKDLTAYYGITNSEKPKVAKIYGRIY